MAETTTLADDLNTLCAFAARGGADRVWLNATADALVTVVLAQRHDPRRRRSLAEAARMANVVTTMQHQGRTHGQAVQSLCERSGLSESWVYALLALHRRQ